MAWNFHCILKFHSQQYPVCMLLLQSRRTLCDPVDCDPLGSSVHEILTARIRAWVTMPSSRGFF